MDRSGLPIPAGGSESFSALLLRLNSQGLRLSGFTLPTQTIAASLNSPGAEHSVPNFPGTGRVAGRLQEYMSRQRNKPEDNNIQFWRNLISEFFAPNAKIRWCVSHYKNCRQIERIFSKGLWRCDMCNEKPCHSLEISGEVLPRLHKMKYDLGMLEERLHVEKPIEYQCATGEIVLHYARAVEEVEYGQAHIWRFGQLRVIFSPDLKIVSWEFCAKFHKENIHQRSMIPQAGQLGAALQNNQANTQGASSVPPEDLQKNIDMFVSSANQKVEALGASYICQIGIAKPYMRYLQASEVLNIMNDLVDYSQKEGLAPRESMAKFPRFGSNSSARKNLNEQSAQKKARVAGPSFAETSGNVVAPKEVEYIDVENYVFRNNDGLHATTSGLAPRDQTNMDVVPRDIRSKYLDELEDYLLNELDIEAMLKSLDS